MSTFFVLEEGGVEEEFETYGAALSWAKKNLNYWTVVEVRAHWEGVQP